MANLVESSLWEPGIYQWEVTDPVKGGADGVDNLPTRQLANRTLFLRDRVQPANQGGTGLTAYVAGDLLYASGPGTLARAPIGAANQVLTSAGATPQWSDSLNLPGSVSLAGSIGVGAAAGLASLATLQRAISTPNAHHYGLISTPTVSPSPGFQGYGAYIRPDVAANAGSVSLMGVQILSPNVGPGASVYSMYGLYISALPATANRYAIYVEGSSDPSLFQGQVRAGSLGVGNSVSAATLGTLSRKMQVYDINGNSIGFVPIYATIT